jgi:ribosomal-protein-alanine N-acetyltransferase
MSFILETERLILRELDLPDANGMFELDSDPEVVKYLNRAPVSSIEESIEVIKFIRSQYQKFGIGRWAVIEKNTGEFIGWSGLKLATDNINGHTNFYDIGYRLISRHWGKGYATESAKVALAYGTDILKTDKIYGMCHIENLASKKVLEKIGLVSTTIFMHDNCPHYWFE